MVTLKNLIAIAGLSLVGPGLTSCRDRSNDFTYHGKFKGYDTNGKFEEYDAVAFSMTQREFTLKEGENYIFAVDSNRDGRFDEISIHLPKGHALEKYVSLQKLEEAYAQLKAEHFSKAK